MWLLKQIEENREARVQYVEDAPPVMMSVGVDLG